MGKMYLTPFKGQIKEMVDHTDWFYKKQGPEGVSSYHQTVIRAAQSRTGAGSLENIKFLTRHNDSGEIIQTLVKHGEIVEREEEK